MTEEDIYDNFVINHIGLDYTVMENDKIRKKKKFLWACVPRGASRLYLLIR